MAETGRPSTFTQETADAICERLAGGESLISICSQPPMPPKSVVLQWLLKDEAFQSQYARARALWAESEFEEMFRIADTVLIGEKTKVNSKTGETETTTGDMVDRARLQVDTRKWALARMAPKKYGDRVTQEHTGSDGQPLRIVVTGIPPTPENT